MTREFHPGHYIHLKRIADDQETMDKYVRMKGLRGFAKKLAWYQLEPRRGEYDFSTIVHDAEYCEDHGLHLIFILEDKTFVADNPLPEYLHHLTIDNKFPRGYTAARWMNQYVYRLRELLKAMGRVVDALPGFEGVMGVETSLSLSKEALDEHEYDAIAYRDQYISVIEQMKTSFPNSAYFFNQNFFARGNKYIDEILKYVDDKGYEHVVQGGPDLLQESDSLIDLAYPRYRPWYGSGRKNFIMMSWDSFEEWSPKLKRNHNMHEQHDYAVDNLQCEYILWYPRLEYWREVTNIMADPSSVASSDDIEVPPPPLEGEEEG